MIGSLIYLRTTSARINSFKRWKSVLICSHRLAAKPQAYTLTFWGMSEIIKNILRGIPQYHQSNTLRFQVADLDRMVGLVAVCILINIWLMLISSRRAASEALESSLLITPPYPFPSFIYLLYSSYSLIQCVSKLL